MKSGHSQVLRYGVPCRWLFKGIEKCGLDVAQLLEQLNIQHCDFDQPESPLPLRDYFLVMNTAAEQLGDEWFGITLAIGSNPEDFGLLGYLLQNAKTFGDFTRIFEHYYRVFTPEFDIHFEMEGDYCLFHYYHKEVEEFDPRHDIEFSMALLVISIQQYLKESWLPNMVSFTHSSPDNISPHQKLFGKNLHFNQAKNFIRFEKKLLDLEISSADAGLLAILEEHASQLLSSVKEKQKIIDRIRVFIASNSGHQPVNTESLAYHLNMSVRNLHRLLKEKGTSYQHIRDETLLKLGKEALSETRSSITDIALRLGYSESSAFVRMFKRKTGLTPLQYRKNLARHH